MANRRRTYIREWREFRGLTQQQLAEAIGKSDATVSLLENGKINYTQETLEAIADVLKCEPGDLLSRPPSEPEDIRDIFAKASPEAQKRMLRVVKSLLDGEEEGS